MDRLRQLIVNMMLFPIRVFMQTRYLYDMREVEKMIADGTIKFKNDDDVTV